MVLANRPGADRRASVGGGAFRIVPSKDLSETECLRAELTRFRRWERPAIACPSPCHQDCCQPSCPEGHLPGPMYGCGSRSPFQTKSILLHAGHPPQGHPRPVCCQVPVSFPARHTTIHRLQAARCLSEWEECDQGSKIVSVIQHGPAQNLFSGPFSTPDRLIVSGRKTDRIPVVGYRLGSHLDT